MAAQKLDELQLDIQELIKFSDLAERSRVKDCLMLDIRKLQTEVSRLQEQIKNDSKAKEKGAAITTPVQTVPKCYDVKLTNYAWDQSEKFVKIYVSLKNVHTASKDDVFCEFTNSSVILHANGIENKNYNLPILNLLEEINPEKSHWKTKTDNVIVYLAKVKTGHQWSHLTGTEKKAHSSSAIKQPKVEPNDDPSSTIVGLLKQMYQDGDDEMKKTIEKAWTTSRDGKSSLNDMMPMP